MNLKNAAVFSLLLIIGVGCNHTDNPVDTADQRLEKQILGTWGYPGYSISFDADHNFIQTETMTFSLSDSIRDTLTMIGKYQITDGILRYSEINYSGIHFHSTIIGIASYPFENRVTISDNKLSMQPLQIFVSTENNPGQLRGTWKHEGWSCSYSIDTGRGYSNAKYEEYYTFGDDTTNIHYRIKYLTGPGLPKEYSYDIGGYSYHDSKLSIPAQALRDCQVLFGKNLMLWIPSWGPIEYDRNGSPNSPAGRQRALFTAQQMGKTIITKK